MAITSEAQRELIEAQSEAEKLSLLKALTPQQEVRFSFLLSKIKSLKQGFALEEKTDADLRAAAANMARVLPFDTEESRNAKRQNEALRDYLVTGKQTRTYAGMSVATDISGGFLVPQSFYDKLTYMLKAVDRLWDPAVVTMWESDHGNQAVVPMASDAEVAVIIAENASSPEDEIATVDRLLLAKAPTWRSKKILWSIELLQDSSFPAEDVISAVVAKRFARGIGASNVSTLISGASSGTTSLAAGAVSYADLFNLLGSVDPEYLSSPKCFWLMNFSTLISIYELKDTTGRAIIKPRVDAQGNFVIFEKPVAICPSMDSVSVAAGKPIALGDMSRFVVRTVKNSMTLKRYSQTPNLAENGLVGFEGFVRTNSGLLVASGTNSPVKYLTMHI
jgi:HK97 family phage major capsid protein